jgi:hypothetical protein
MLHFHVIHVTNLQFLTRDFKLKCCNLSALWLKLCALTQLSKSQILELSKIHKPWLSISWSKGSKLLILLNSGAYVPGIQKFS